MKNKSTTRQILKYRLRPNTVTYLPQGKVALIAQQHDQDVPTIWIEVELTRVSIGEPQPINQTMDVVGYRFYGTGHTVYGEHVGSCICGDYVWHVYRG